MSRMSEIPVPDTLVLFVPAAHTRGITQQIRPGSAMVGSKAGNLWLVDYQGNANGAVNLQTFEERLQSAAGRHAQRYPTIARTMADAADLVAVGEVRHSEALKAWIITQLHEPKALQLWIAPEELPRVGGSEEIWSRAAGILASTRAKDLAHMAGRGLNLRDAAYRMLIESEPGLDAPRLDAQR